MEDSSTGVINKPNTFSANTTISASQVNANEDTIYNEFNGNISAANIASNAITTAKIADSNVTTAKVADSAITTAKINDAAVTSPKLAEAFFRGRFQTPSGNTAPTGLTIQSGWNFVVGDNSTQIEKTITFPVAFSSSPIILVSFLGARATASGAPDTTDDFTTWFSAFTGIGTDDITTSNFVATLNASSNYGSTFNFGFSWIAIGAV